MGAQGDAGSFRVTAQMPACGGARRGGRELHRLAGAVQERPWVWRLNLSSSMRTHRGTIAERCGDAGLPTRCPDHAQLKRAREVAAAEGRDAVARVDKLVQKETARHAAWLAADGQE